MSLQPGTRIPRWFSPPAASVVRWYYLGMWMGGVAGFALGLLAGACMAALAWAHMGG